MRTRDEQIEDLTNLFGEEGTFSFVDDRNAATKHILEAERRAEQRVRAEIARDSERLDWLSGMVQEISRVSNRPTQWILEFPTPLRSLDRDDLRQAIDAARDIGTPNALQDKP